MYIPLQVRLTCFYILLLALALCFFGSILMIQASQRAYADLDATLNSRAESVRLGKFLGNQQTLPTILPGIAGVGSEGIAIEVLDTQRHLLATTDGSPADPLQSPLYLEGTRSSPVPWDISTFQKSIQQVNHNPDLSRGTYSTVFYQGQQVRVYTLASDSMGQLHIIQTARSTQPIEQSLNNLRLILFGAGILVVLLAALGGWLMTQGILNRVQRITRTAHGISQKQDVSQRIVAPGRGGRDELSQLAETFNSMLDRLEALYAYQQRFVADASHELRAPITSIRCNLDLLNSAPNLPPEEIHAALADTQTEAERMGRLVNDLLTLAHADAHRVVSQKQSIDLDSLLLEVFRQYRLLQKNDQEQAIQQPRLLLQDITPAQVLGDSDQLKQVLVALIDNAIKYTPPEGTIALQLTTESSQAILRIKDTGIGITSEEIPHIFERFYRSPRIREQSGSGLGLAIVQSILHRHQGSITVESRLHEGTTFTVNIPLGKELSTQEKTEPMLKILPTRSRFDIT